MPSVSNAERQARLIRDGAAAAIADLRAVPTPTLDDQQSRARTLSLLVSAWETAVERIRICRKQPLPGSLRPAPVPRGRGGRREAAPGHAEPVDVLPPDREHAPREHAPEAPAASGGGDDPQSV